MKNNQEVASITEAFSMQPCVFYVGGGCSNVNILRIELEFETEWPNGMQRGEYVYHGYDKNGNVLFEFMANTVNVTYRV